MADLEKITKSDAEIIFQIHAEYICKRFGFGDDQEPTVRIESMRDCYGSFEKTRGSNIIRIIPSVRFNNDTLIHELAHYVQKNIEGKTCCWDMRRDNRKINKKYDDAICERHAEYMKQIRAMIERKM